MPAYHLGHPEPWANALDRLEATAGGVAVSWAAVRNEGGAWTTLAITVRGGVEVPDRSLVYEHIGIWTRMRVASVAAEMLRNGFLTRESGDREFEEIRRVSGQATWLTSDWPYGLTGPVPTPSFYFSVQLTDDATSRARLDQPAVGPGLPFYLTTQDALMEHLYGITLDQGRRDIINQVVVHLPYTDAYLEYADYVDGAGIVVRVGEGAPGMAAGHQLQALWKLQKSERSYQRDSRDTSDVSNPFTFSVAAEPTYVVVSLQDAAGRMIDMIQRDGRRDRGEPLAPLPAEALPEALDFLSSVWRSQTGDHLFSLHRISATAQLATPVYNRADFVSHMTDLAETFKSIAVADPLINVEKARGLARDSTLGRLKLALEQLLDPGERQAATAAVDVLQDIVGVRTALQHPLSRGELPTALARLAIAYPADWPQLWELMRHRAVAAVRDLRQALESGSSRR